MFLWTVYISSSLKGVELRSKAKVLLKQLTGCRPWHDTMYSVCLTYPSCFRWVGSCSIAHKKQKTKTISNIDERKDYFHLKINCLKKVDNCTSALTTYVTL